MALLFDRVDWHLLVRAKTRPAFDELVKAIGRKAGATMRVVSAENQEGNDLWDARLSSTLGVERAEEAVFRVMLMMKELGTGWQVNGPIPYDEGRWFFGALASAPQARFNVLGMEWAHVELRNFVMLQSSEAVPKAPQR